MNTQQEFIAWESATRDTIDFKKCYVDAAGGDLVAGLLLSQIVYWHLPSARAHESRLRVAKDGVKWLAKVRTDWWDECRISPKQFDRACSVLEERGLIVSAVMKFNNNPTKHIRIVWDVFMAKVEAAIWAEAQRQKDKERGKSKLPDGGNGNYPLGNNEIPETGSSRGRVDAGASSEITSETTTQTQSAPSVQSASSDASNNEEVMPCDPPPATKRTLPNIPATGPPMEDVRAFFKAEDCEHFTQHFFDVYAQKGWRVGSSPMKDWKAAARTYILNPSGYARPALPAQKAAPAKAGARTPPLPTVAESLAARAASRAAPQADTSQKGLNP